MPKIYNSKHLVKYEDAIVLHFDFLLLYAWLKLRNYGGLFNQKPPDIVTEASVGKESKPAFHLAVNISAMLDAVDVIKFQLAIMKSPGTEKLFCWKNLLSLIVQNLKQHCRTDIQGYLKPIETYDPHYDRAPHSYCYEYLEQLLGKFRYLVPPLGPSKPGQTIQDAIEWNKSLGFTAYFPKHSLILEEERTAWTDFEKPPKADEARKPWTVKEDPRDIKLILAQVPKPPKSALDENLKALKSKRPDDPFTLYLTELDQRIKDHPEYAKDFREKRRECGYLHADLDRVWCYTLRGDTRDLEQIKKAGGMLAAMTRRDDGVFFKKEDDGTETPKMYVTAEDSGTKTVKEVEEEISDLLRPPSYEEMTKPNSGERRSVEEDYFNLLHKYQILHLGVYVAQQDYKGFISTTRSSAIAKRFANWYSATVECFTYCYAVRCRGGFALPSTADRSKRWVQTLTKLHNFVGYAEQEVAMPGAIWWEDVVGMRVIRCDEEGQFFSGPIFLQDALTKEYHKRKTQEGAFHKVQVPVAGRRNKDGKVLLVTYKDGNTPRSDDEITEYQTKRIKVWLPEPDDAAFSELFELLSGRSQGDRPEVVPILDDYGKILGYHSEIFRSYEKPPWQ